VTQPSPRTRVTQPFPRARDSTLSA
jgi:hypothetical protein